MIDFLWPEALQLEWLLPLLIGGYVWLLRRKRATVRHADLALVRQALGKRSTWRRWVPPLLLLLAVAVLLAAAARPTAVVDLPTEQETIVLAMDVSGSMRATDVKPDRITAAQDAAKAFVRDLPRNARIAVVSFAGTAAVVQPPTNNHEDVIAAIDRFQLQRGTAIGSGLLLSLATLFPDAGIDLSDVTGERAMPTDPLRPDKVRPASRPVPPGSYGYGAIVLLTDGQRTVGPDPLEAGRLVADRGVKVYAVGIGTKDGETIGFEGWSMRVKLDEDTLKTIAQTTHGEYFYAGTATDLKQVYQSLSARMVVERKETEITALFAAAAALLVVLAAGLSTYWFARVM